jgi:hypothetical protein
MRKKLSIVAFLLVNTVLFTACNKDENNPPVITNFSGTLSGANETPPTGSAATGTVDFSFNGSTKILTGTVTYSGLTATAAHIHSGAVGVAGPVVFPLGETSLASPISFTSVALDAAQESDLMNNLYYVNIHSAAFPGGEIRAQLTKQ